MNIIQRNKSAKERGLPSRLEVLEALTKRSLYPNPKEISELNRLRAGQEGEDVVIDYLQKYGKTHWALIQNLWLDYFGTLECDGILFTNGELYVLEIKNYSGTYAYDNGISKLNNREMSANAIYQTRKAAMKVRELINRRFPNIKVHGVLVFVCIDSQIIITPDIDDIHIIQRHELRAFIEKMGATENTHSNHSMDLQKVINLFENYTTQNPYPVEPLSPDVLSNLQKGILCVNCANSQVEVTRKFIKCACGKIELREAATIRTICEYGVLNFTEPLTVSALIDFFNGQARKSYLNKIMTTYFDLQSRGREDYFKNNATLYFIPKLKNSSKK